MTDRPAITTVGIDSSAADRSADRWGVEDGDLLYASGERCTSHIESVVVQRNRSTPRVHGPGTNHVPRLLPTVSASILDLLRLIWYPSQRIKESP